MTPASMTPESSRDTRIASDSLRGIRVVLVDDESDERTLLAEVLAGLGAEVRICDSAAAARAALLEHRPDLLISDIGMPRESGLDLVRSIRAMAPDQGGTVPAIALTGYSQESLRVEALSAGYDRHVEKPVQPSELVALAAAVIASRRRESPESAGSTSS